MVCSGIVGSLVDANPIKTGLVNERRVGSCRPRTGTDTLIEDKIECLVERPLALVEFGRRSGLAVSEDLITIEIPSQSVGLL